VTVLQAAKYYPPAVGGIEQAVASLAEGLPHDTSVLCVAERGFGGAERRNGVSIRRVAGVGTVWSLPVAPTFPLRLRQVAADADLIHYHLPNPLAVAGHLAVVPDGATAVATYHSDIVRQRAVTRLYRPLLRRFLDSMDRVIVTSPRLRDNARGLDGHRSNCRVVPLSIDLDCYDGTAPEVPLPTDDRPTLLFVGRLSYYKGVEVLVEAMQDIDATLLIAGDGERRKRVEALVDDLGLDDSVQLLGRVPETTLKACYDAADIFVLPSVAESEAFGIVQLEAMAYETPVVNTALPTGVPWVSRHEETGLTVPPGDSGALAATIDGLLGDDDRRESYGRAARRRVEACFGRASMIERTTDLYAELGVSPE